MRLAGQEPELVFVEGEDEAAGRPRGPLGADHAAAARLAEGRVEAAAAREGVSVNTWLVRALARAADGKPRTGLGRRLTGYGRS